VKRDAIKTIIGIIVIAGIVVATYLYGNHQRQLQLDREQSARQHQQVATAPSTAPVSPTVRVSPAAPTAPVASVQPNAIQGSGAATPDTSGSSVSLSQGNLAPAPGSAGTQPLANTGSGLSTSLQVGIISFAVIAFVRSRRQFALALRSIR
jgi:hypothetical protein